MILITTEKKITKKSIILLCESDHDDKRITLYTIHAYFTTLSPHEVVSGKLRIFV